MIIFFEVPNYYTFINFTLIGTGCLGHGDWNSSAQPELVEALLSVHVTAVACGPEHVVVVGSQGDVYAWGRGSEGRLGLGHEEDTYLPQVQSESEIKNYLKILYFLSNFVIISILNTCQGKRNVILWKPCVTKKLKKNFQVKLGNC
jgi:hypothetical protein